MKWETKHRIKDFFGSIIEKFLLHDENGDDNNYFAYFFFVFTMIVSYGVSSSMVFRNNGVGIVFSAIFSFIVASGIQFLIKKLEKWLNDWKY